MVFVYVLRSEKTGRRYIGITSDLNRRLVEHNTGQNSSTRAGAPWKMIHSEAYETRTLETKREKALKSGQGRAWLDQMELQAMPIDESPRLSS